MSVNVFTKVLAGVPDVLFGNGTKTQTRNGTNYNVERVALIKPLANIAALQALDVTDEDNFYAYAETMGLNSPGDGDPRTWWFDIAEPISSDNGKTIFAGSGATVGCWKLAKPVILNGTTTSLSTHNITVGPYTFTVTRSLLGIYGVTHNLGVNVSVIAMASASSAILKEAGSSSTVSFTLGAFDVTGAAVDTLFEFQLVILPNA